MAVDIQAIGAALPKKEKDVVAPKKKAGRPVGTLVGSASMQPQYPALRKEVTAAHPITELSPEVKDLMAKAGKVASDQLSGVISPDVQAQIQRISAEKGLKSGLGATSQAARNLTARDLGLTSVDIQQRGLESATKLAEFDANLMGQRMDFLKNMRALDLDANQMRIQNRQFKQEVNLKRFALLSDNISSYYRTAFSYEAQKNASQDNLSDFQESIKDINNRLRSIVGVPQI